MAKTSLHSTASDRKPWLRLLQAGIGLACGIGFVMILTRTVDADRVAALVSTAAPLPLVAALVSFCLSFALRTERFNMLIAASHGEKPKLGESFAPFVASFGISDILPLRIGDGFRILWFNRQFGIPAGTLTGAMIFERILDLVTLALIGAVAILLARSGGGSAVLGVFTIITAAALGGGLVLLLAPAVLVRLLSALFPRTRFGPLLATLDFLRSASTALLRIGSWRRVALLSLQSMVIWALEGLVLLFAWISLGQPASALPSLLLPFAFSTLGTLVPSLPGHFGSFEYFGMLAFGVIGIEAGLSIAVLLLAHLVLWAPTALFAVVWLLKRALLAPKAPAALGL